MQIDNLKKLYKEIGNKNKLLIASKTRSVEEIEPLILEGHELFGENRVQEAIEKWPTLKEKHPKVKLHLIGHLQTNKAKHAIEIFDTIETLDREKLAIAINKFKTNIACYIQVNTGEEAQKSGVIPSEFNEFFNFCKNDCSLNIEGLMCIPPVDEPPSLHFALLANIAKKYNISKLSMGMSNDYETALNFGTSHVRIGTAIFGQRDSSI